MDARPRTRPVRFALAGAVPVAVAAALPLVLLGSAGGAAAADSGTSSSTAATVALSGSGNAGPALVGLGLSGSTPTVVAPAAPGVASSGAGLGLSAAVASSGVQVVTSTATRTSSSTSAQSTVAHASVSGFGASLLNTGIVSSQVSCPASGSASASTSAVGVTVGGRGVNASAGTTTDVAVTVPGLTGANVAVTVSSPHSAQARSAAATGLLATLSLRGTVPVVGTAVNVPLGSVALARTSCSAPDSGAITTPPTGPTATVPGGPGGPGAPGAGPTNTPPAAAKAPLRITTIRPDQGPTSGGQRVTVTGSGFVPGATTLTLDGKPATAIAVNAAGTALTATTPPGPAGPVDVTVGTPAHHATLYDGYTYVAPGAPVIGSIAPDSGPTAGGQIVTVTGSGFTSPETVIFGTSAATDVHVLSPTKLTAVTPAHVAGGVEVKIQSPAGASATRPYTYVPDGAAAGTTDCPKPAAAVTAGSNGGGMSTAGAVAIGVAAAMLGAVLAGLALFGARRGMFGIPAFAGLHHRAGSPE